MKNEEDFNFLVNYLSISLAFHGLDGVMLKANMLGYVDSFHGHSMYQVDSVFGESGE